MKTTLLIFLCAIILALGQSFMWQHMQENGTLQRIRATADKISQAFFAMREPMPAASDEGIMIPAFPLTTGKTGNQSFHRVCYYYWRGLGPDQLSPNSIDPFLCTHIILGFLSVKNSTLIPHSDVSSYQMLVDLKKTNPSLLVMLSVGGGGGGGSEISQAVKPENRNRFITSIITLLRTYGFDGIDIDWEFPAWSGGPPEDKQNFAQFLRDLKSAQLIEGVLSNQNPLILSVAVAAVRPIIRKSYEIQEMAKYVDFINMMSYDYHDYRWYLPFTGHNSPLFKRSIEHSYFATLNTAWSAAYWISNGLPREKLMVGLPTYGRTYKLFLTSMHGFDAPAKGPGIGNGDICYPDVCKFLKAGATRVFDEESKVPYAYKGFDWIGYDDYESIQIKAQWVKSQQFGGIMTFDLNCDDWQGTCDGKTTFPLHRIIYSVLAN